MYHDTALANCKQQKQKQKQKIVALPPLKFTSPMNVSQLTMQHFMHSNFSHATV
jgi:hypothetical protein